MPRSAAYAIVIADDMTCREEQPMGEAGPLLHTPTPSTQATRRGTRRLVRRRPLLCFFVLAYTISWLAWLPYVLSDDGLGVLRFRLAGAYLGQMIALPGAYLGPLSAAFVVTALADGKSGLRRWWQRLTKWRVNWRWYLFALAGVPALLVLGTLPLPGAAEQLRMPTAGTLAAYLPLLIFQVLSTGIAEEPGWRDFALPRIQRRYGPLTGTLVLGVLWAGWHLPLFLTQWALVRLNLLAVGQFLLMSVAFSIPITWVFNRCGQSLPIAMLLHASHNNLFSVLWSDLFPHLNPSWNQLNAALIAYGALAVVLIALTRGRLGYPRDTPPGQIAPPLRPR
jgi:membrane protease YdiL (CAAX protease family)